MTVPMEESLILFDFDDEEDDTNVLEKALSEEKNPVCDKDENKSPSIETDEDMGDEIHSMLHKFGGMIFGDMNLVSKEENVSFSVKRKNFQGSLERPMEICYLSSDEEKDGSTSEKEVFEERNPLTQDDGNANPEEIVGDTQSQIQNILGKIEGDINKTLHVKRKHMETYIKDSFKGSNQKLEQVWKMNKRERKKINSKFCKQYITTFQKFDMDVQKFNEEQEKSANNYQKQQKAFKLSKSSQNQSLQAIREVHEKFMKGLMDLETNNHDMLLGLDGELRKEMCMFKKNLMKHTLKFSSAFETSD